MVYRMRVMLALAIISMNEKMCAKIYTKSYKQYGRYISYPFFYMIQSFSDFG